MSPQLRRFLASVILTPTIFVGSLYLHPEWLASLGCIVALFVGLPTSILLYLDYGRAKASSSPSRSTTIRVLATPVVLLGATSLALGCAIIGWVVFNTFLERQPSYTGSVSIIPRFGIGPALVIFGWRKMRRPFTE